MEPYEDQLSGLDLDRALSKGARISRHAPPHRDQQSLVLHRHALPTPTPDLSSPATPSLALSSLDADADLDSQHSRFLMAVQASTLFDPSLDWPSRLLGVEVVGAEGTFLSRVNMSPENQLILGTHATALDGAVKQHLVVGYKQTLNKRTSVTATRSYGIHGPRNRLAFCLKPSKHSQVSISYSDLSVASIPSPQMTFRSSRTHFSTLSLSGATKLGDQTVGSVCVRPVRSLDPTLPIVQARIDRSLGCTKQTAALFSRSTVSASAEAGDVQAAFRVRATCRYPSLALASSSSSPSLDSSQLPSVSPLVYCEGTLGNVGSHVSWGAGLMFSGQERLELGVSAGSLGLSLNLQFATPQSTFSVPIVLSERPSPRTVVGCLLLPLVFAACLRPILRPVLQRWSRSHRRSEVASRAALRDKARQFQQVMRAQSNAVLHAEQAADGLIILEAWYGLHPEAEQREEKETVIDVRVPLQMFVKNSKLILSSKSKSNLLGFCSPTGSEEERLFVRYSYHGQVAQVLVADDEALSLPTPWDTLQAISTSTLRPSS